VRILTLPLFAVETLDAITETYYGREQNPWWRRRFVRSDGLYAEQTAGQAALAWLGWRMHHSRRWWLRNSWWLPQSAQLGIVVRAVIPSADGTKLQVDWGYDQTALIEEWQVAKD